MRISYQTFALPKEGRNFDDYEDAYFPCRQAELSAETGALNSTEQFHAAVCDGATDSCFSQYWARLLATGYGQGKWFNEFSETAIKDEQALWQKELDSKELPWYAEEKAEQGAFAAMIGVSFFDDKQRWTALGIGDSCVFQTRKGELIKAFPLSKPDDFNNFPMLVGSLPKRNKGLFDKTKNVIEDEWQTGDVFFLMSDALACWFLSELQESIELIGWLCEVEDHDEFADVVSKERKSVNAAGNLRMRDDDATFTRIVVHDKATPLAPKAVSSRKHNAAPASLNRATGERTSVSASGSPSVGAQPTPASSPPVPDAGPVAQSSSLPRVPSSTAQTAFSSRSFGEKDKAKGSNFSKIVVVLCILFVVAIFLGKGMVETKAVPPNTTRVKQMVPPTVDAQPNTKLDSKQHVNISKADPMHPLHTSKPHPKNAVNGQSPSATPHKPVVGEPERQIGSPIDGEDVDSPSVSTTITPAPAAPRSSRAVRLPGFVKAPNAVSRNGRQIKSPGPSDDTEGKDAAGLHLLPQHKDVSTPIEQLKAN